MLQLEAVVVEHPSQKEMGVDRDPPLVEVCERDHIPRGRKWNRTNLREVHSSVSVRARSRSRATDPSMQATITSDGSNVAMDNSGRMEVRPLSFDLFFFSDSLFGRLSGSNARARNGRETLLGEGTGVAPHLWVKVRSTARHLNLHAPGPPRTHATSCLDPSWNMGGDSSAALWAAGRGPGKNGI